ncbi:MAG: GPW/gp25 family protein [bacterium]|nr:GPW/gp25 family protein [bacterium]
MSDEVTTGKGISYPLTREHGDYATATGATLIKSNIRCVLGVRASSSDGVYRGEYPWRLDFGSQIDRARHTNIDEDIRRDLMRVRVVDAISRWEPRALAAPGDIVLDDIAGGRRAKMTVTFQVDTGQLGNVSTEAVEATVG